MFSRFSLSAILGCFILTGCGGVDLIPGAENVSLLSRDPLSPYCRALGPVSGSNDMWISDDLDATNESARNDMLNKAYLKGGNLVVLTSHESTPPTQVSSGQVVETGDAYFCQRIIHQPVHTPWKLTK